MPNFFGGLAQGLQSGGLNDAVDYLIKQRQAKKMAEAIDRTMGGGGAQPGQTDPIAALARLTGGTAAPQPQTAPAPAPQAGPGPMAAPAPRPQPAPGQPTGAPGAEAPTGMAVDPQVANPEREAESIIKNIWQTTRAANPKADPRTILAAVQTQLDEVKGVAPITKATMQGQLAYLKEMQNDQYRQARLQQFDNQFHVNMMKAKTAEERNQITKDWQEGRLRILQEHEDTHATSVDDQHEDRQAAEAGRNTRNAANNSTREDVADKNNTTRENISQDRSDDSTYRADQGVRSSQIRSGQQPGPAPQRGGPRAGPNKVVKVSSPDEIRKLPKGTRWVSADGSRRGIAP